MDDSSEQLSSRIEDPQITRAIAVVRSSIPAGLNTAIVAALDALAQYGDALALAEVEACLISGSLAESYGDRDDDPPDWKLDPRAFKALARWWQRLGLAAARGSWLAEDWLGDQRHFGWNGYQFFIHAAPELAEIVAPLLIAHLHAPGLERQRRVVDGLGYLPTAAALDALVASLGHADEPIRNAARSALSRSAQQPATAERLIAALGAPSPLVRTGALRVLVLFAAQPNRNSIVVPVLFVRAFPLVVGLLRDPEPAVRQLAAERINATGSQLDMLRPSRAEPLRQALVLPALDLLALLDQPDPAFALAAIYLAGRSSPLDDAQPAALAARIIARLESLRPNYYSYKAALYALGRLGAAEAIPIIAAHLDDPKAAFYVDAALVLGRMGYLPAIEHLTRLLADISYQHDAREGIEAFDPAAVLGRLNDWLHTRRRSVYRYVETNLTIARYLEANGDAYSLALLRQTENYHFAARYAGAENDQLVGIAQRLERRLLAEAGASAQAIDDPREAVRRILSGPLHPAEQITHDARGAVLPDGELRARWRNLCVAIVGWRRADPALLEQAIEVAEPLLEAFPDHLREAHESWWLDVRRGSSIGLPPVSNPIRAVLQPRAPWRLARALVINEGLQSTLDPASCFAWPGLASIRILELPLDFNWLRALVAAPAHVAPQRLRVLLGGDAMALALAEWPGLERLELLEVIWSNRLSEAARAELGRRVRVHYW